MIAIMRISRRALLLGATGSFLQAATKREQGLTPPRIFDPERALPALANYRRKAIRLHPQPSHGTLVPSASKIGGRFLWPAAEPSPYCKESNPVGISPMTLDRARDLVRMEKMMRLDPKIDAIRAQQQIGLGLPKLTAAEEAEARHRYDEALAQFEQLKQPHNDFYQPLLQLRRDDFPELPWPSDKDLLHVLWCPHLHLWGNHGPSVGFSQQTPGHRIVWRAEASIKGELAPLPAPPRNGVVLAEHRFTPEDIVEYPQSFELGVDYIAAMPQLQGWFDSVRRSRPDDPPARFLYDEEIAVAPDTKLLGYALWIQEPDIPRCTCGRAMSLLATIAGENRPDLTMWQPASIPRVDLDLFGFADSDIYMFYCAATHPIRISTQIQSS